jgi:hypothetical protein
MKVSRIGSILALSLILSLLITLIPTPVHAAEYLFLYPYKGEVGTWMEINGTSFRENDTVSIYFSSQKAAIGDSIDEKVTAYEQIITLNTDDTGTFSNPYNFFLPDALTDGEEMEDVHSGTYYFYAVYYRSYEIVASIPFTVVYGEISLDIEEGAVGTEVAISGQRLRPNQAITIKYDDNAIATSSGDSQSDENGDFNCTAIIPKSTAGSHTISAVDESGDAPEAEFTVIPMITLNPTEQLTGGEVQVSGTGFARRGNIFITLNGKKVTATPSPLSADHYGSFEGSFLVPTNESYGTEKVEVSDNSGNKVQTQLAVRGGITLSPTTSLTSPGHVGTKLTITGTGFITGSEVDITYSNNGETIPVATVTAENGTFWVAFTIPSSAAGSHTITASYGTNQATATFILESQAPPTPTPLTPEAAGTAAARAYFDWSDVSDDSGVSYTLQIAIDPDFNFILLNKVGLEASEYTLSKDEELASSQKDAPFYWRVKAVDGALNESDWTYPCLFYIGFSLSSLPPWAWYVLGIVAATVLAIVGYWLWKKRTRRKDRTL